MWLILIAILILFLYFNPVYYYRLKSMLIMKPATTDTTSVTTSTSPEEFTDEISANISKKTDPFAAIINK